MNKKNDSDEMTPEKAVAILAKHGTRVTIDEAAKVVDFMRMLVDLQLYQFQKDACKETTADISKKERLL